MLYLRRRSCNSTFEVLNVVQCDLQLPFTAPGNTSVVLRVRILRPLPNLPLPFHLTRASGLLVVKAGTGLRVSEAPASLQNRPMGPDTPVLRVCLGRQEQHTARAAAGCQAMPRAPQAESHWGRHVPLVG